MTTATITSKGQLVIPAAIRLKHHIEQGTKVIIEEHGEDILIRKITPAHFNQIAGILKSKRSLSKKLLDERRKDHRQE